MSILYLLDENSLQEMFLSIQTNKSISNHESTNGNVEIDDVSWNLFFSAKVLHIGLMFEIIINDWVKNFPEYESIELTGIFIVDNDM